VEGEDSESEVDVDVVAEELGLMVRVVVMVLVCLSMLDRAGDDRRRVRGGEEVVSPTDSLSREGSEGARPSRTRYGAGSARATVRHSSSPRTEQDRSEFARLGIG
jgi:hypothetical protein